ncbi:MAG: alpha/beta hydrolase family esterase, partial [Gammaproteobacteria bacterium]
VLFASAALLALSGLAAAVACETGGRCEVEGGYYLAAPPPDWDGKSELPLVVYFHGWNGSPEGTFRNRAMISAVHERGAMFVAPYAHSGYWRQIGEGRAEGGRDELAYVHAVMADLERRWPIDTRRAVASGFSRGASMVWNVACYASPLFRAYAPIAGGFWNSNPDECPTGPVSLRHIHGLSDGVVAFDEVGIYNSMPIPQGMARLRRLNGCAELPDETRAGGRYDCAVWSSCDTRAELQLCLHPRGHSIPAEWVAEGFDWMLELPK